MTYKAFISSTFEDLKDHRREVIASLRKAGIVVDPMEDWTAAYDEPKKFSEDRIRDCDICVLLVGFRRGHVPKGETSSITQIEYKAALKMGIAPALTRWITERQKSASSRGVPPAPIVSLSPKAVHREAKYITLANADRKFGDIRSERASTDEFDAAMNVSIYSPDRKDESFWTKIAWEIPIGEPGTSMSIGWRRHQQISGILTTFRSLESRCARNGGTRPAISWCGSKATKGRNSLSSSS